MAELLDHDPSTDIALFREAFDDDVLQRIGLGMSPSMQSADICANASTWDRRAGVGMLLAL